MQSDPGEQIDLSAQHPEVTQRLSNQLQTWLNDMQAKKPAPDPEYDQKLDLERRANLKNEFLPSLEKRRMERLQPGWRPNEDWWGSEVIDD